MLPEVKIKSTFLGFGFVYGLRVLFCRSFFGNEEGIRQTGHGFCARISCKKDRQEEMRQ